MVVFRCLLARRRARQAVLFRSLRARVPLAAVYRCGLVAVPAEERALQAAFDKDYKVYCGRVRRWM